MLDFKLYINVIDSSFFALILLIIASNFILQSINKLDTSSKYANRTAIFAVIQIFLQFISSYTNILEVPNSKYISFILYSLSYLNGIVVYYYTTLFICTAINSYSITTKIKRFLLIPMASLLVMIIINMFIPYIFETDNYGKSISLTFRFLPTLVVSFYIAFLIEFLVKHAKEISNASKAVLMTLIIFPIIVKIFEHIFNVYYSFWPVYTLCIVLIFMYLKTIKPLKDPVTGLLNINAFTKKMESIENDYEFSFALISLDNIESIIEKYGVNEGYICLNNFAKILKKNLSRKNSVISLGSDEFLIYYDHNDKSIIEESLIVISNNIRNSSNESSLPYTLTFSSKYEIYDKERFSNYLELIKYLYYSMYNEQIQKDSN